MTRTAALHTAVHRRRHASARTAPLALALIVITGAAAPGDSRDPALSRARRLPRSAPLIDGHNDLPWAIRERKTAQGDLELYDLRTRAPGHTDLARLEQGGCRRPVLVGLHPRGSLWRWRPELMRLASQAPSDSARGAVRERFWKEHVLPAATLGQVADHIEHVRRVAGVDHVGLGADYDGTRFLPAGLEDVSKYPELLAELIRRGWSDRDLRKLAGENVLRAMREAETVARRLQRERRPSEVTIEALDGAGAPNR